MKKLFLMLAVASLSLNAMAQEDPTEKYLEQLVRSGRC